MKQHTLPLEQLQAWAHLNNCKLNGIKVEPHVITHDGIDKGGGLIATADHASGSVLLSVDSSVILCKEQVWQRAKTDRHLSQILDALGDFVQTPRKLILVFLIMQMTNKCSDLSQLNIGLSTPLTDYYSFLPKEIPLPTFYSDEEREMLIGTSLSDALDQKLTSLELEFKVLRERTESLDWAQKAWWHEETEKLTFEDWLLADAIYRSRALELPRDVGDAMVPVLDMANHASDGRCNARFERDSNGDVLLVVRDGKTIHEGEEITIMYGCGGACEMLFSYGFIEEGVVSAREMFLGLEIPHDDPLRLPKYHYAKEAPGVRIFIDDTRRMQWDSDFVWWTCINEEDGLDFKLLQTVDGGRHLQATWQGSALVASELKTKLHADPRMDLFELRAVVMIQERVERQGEELGAGLTDSDARLHKPYASVRTITRLRELELELLTVSYAALDDQKKRLLSSRTVSEYLSAVGTNRVSEGQEEDFA